MILKRSIIKRKDKEESLSEQIKNRVKRTKVAKEPKKYDGSDIFVSTGSTLLDLAISGGRVRGGGIPGGILVEIFGPSGAGKTVMLCEIAGGVQRLSGQILFKDPEARLNKQFAKIFDMELKEEEYDTPNTVPEVFSSVRDWKIKDPQRINGAFADSLAALSTGMEMDTDEGDKMGMRRAKEFSEECRKTCRILTDRNILMVCSNQVRVNLDAGKYGIKYKTPGGEAIPFYSSLRLRCMSPKKIKQGLNIAGKKVERISGVETPIEVFKSSVWKPYRKASVYIMFDYGIDDIRGNLQFIKQHTSNTSYTVNGEKVGSSMEAAIAAVEKDDLEDDLKEEVIDLWEEIETKFTTKRKKKER